MSFVHLHTHTQFSIADGALRIGEMVAFAKAEGMPAIALTDHDNLHGALEFADACKSQGVKGIYGCCIGINARPVGEHVKRVHHMTLLAMDETGWLNLMFLVSMAHLKSPAGAPPRISHDLLAEHSEGLIGLSGDLSGEIANALLRSEPTEAKRLLARYKSMFAPGHFYLECQLGGMQEHETVVPQLIALGEQTDTPCVATNDVHYGKPHEARAHEVLMCIGLGIQAQAGDLPTTQLDLATGDEMRRRFARWPALCEATLAIAERCNFKLAKTDPMLPRFPVPEGMDEATLFATLAREGLARRMQENRAKGEVLDDEVYNARLEREIGVITKMDFPGYFLIVQDFINWAKTQGIPVGPGRGSGAGSLVAYSLRITDLDPLPYKLLFERFLNPERVSMPDFDIDFCVDRRGEVIRYVADKYGHDRVGQIATFGTLKAKGAIRDVGRVLAVPLPEVDRIAKLMDVALEPLDEKHKTVKDAIAGNQQLRDEMSHDAVVEKLLETAQLLEGAVRNVGMHAAGVVIGRGPLWEHVPVGKGQAGENVTQFDKDDVEKAGLVKFDFLGLKNLTMIRHCVDIINAQKPAGEVKFEIEQIPLDEPRAFAVTARGDTAGIFQTESSGFTGMLVALKPSEFEDLIAAGALYRPGPLGMHMDKRYIERKHKREEVVFPHPMLSEVLEETYGVIVYQEQVMQVAQILAGFTLGQADNLRRAMGKKKADEMAKWGEIFKEGAVARGVDAQVATDVFALMAQFAEYGFNKSHSAAYGLITYQTAYLKALYPTEFYAALLTADQGDTDRVVQNIQNARTAGIAVLPPDVNESSLSFSVASGKIRFGLGAIKGLGESAVEALVLARQSGPFESLFDLCRRVDTRKLNRKALECLVKCGAMDGFKQARDVLWSNIGRAVERAQDEQKKRESAQSSLFGLMLDDPGVKIPDNYGPAEEKWTDRQQLQFEKDILGFYVSGHPLDRYAAELHRLNVQQIAVLKDPEYVQKAIRNLDPRGRARRPTAQIAVVVVSNRERVTQKGERMANTVVEDRSGQIELVIFPRTLGEMGHLLQGNAPLLLTVSLGFDSRDDTKVQLAVDNAKPLDEAMLAKSDALKVVIDIADVQARKLEEIKTVLRASPGNAKVQLHVQSRGVGEVVIATHRQWQVALSDDLIGKLERILGRGAARMG
jgi:DNA polymerase-3 subunit alpha